MKIPYRVQVCITLSQTRQKSDLKKRRREIFELSTHSYKVVQSESSIELMSSSNSFLIRCFFSLSLSFVFSCGVCDTSVTNYNDYKTSSSTMYPVAAAAAADATTTSKSSRNQQSLHDGNIYGDKVTMEKHTENIAMNEPKSMNNSNYGNDTNFSNVLTTSSAGAATSTGTSSTPPNGKMLVEHMIKSEKPKSFIESANCGSKSECNENGQRIDESGGNSANSMNHMNLIGTSHQSSSICYPSTVLDPSAIESTMSNDDLCYRGYAPSSNELSASFANDMMANRALVANYEYSTVRGYENAMNGYDMNLGNLYARSNLAYPSYLNSFGADVDLNQQKYLHDPHHHHHHHYSSTAMLKNDSATAEAATPYYPKPMYHYDSAFPLTGFSAMNLSLRMSAAAAAAAAGGGGGAGPIIDFTPSNVTSSNLHATNSPHYTTAVQRLQANSASTTPKSTRTPPNSSPQAISSEQQLQQQQPSDSNRMPMNNLKLQSYQLHGENFAPNSRTSPSEPVDLCNSEIGKPTHSGAFAAAAATTGTTDNQSIETAQNRPFSRESTSDSNASPYVDAYKGDPMGKFYYCSCEHTSMKL